MASLLGSEVGPYRILRLVGKGGMGEVYAARDDRLGREVAIKAMSPELAASGFSGGLTPTAIVSLGLSLFLGVGLGFWWGRRRR